MEYIIDLYRKITKKLIDINFTISTMEGCTSGLIAALLTNEPGASNIMKGSCVTYNNRTKELYYVKDIDVNGVYSTTTSINMAKACQRWHKTIVSIGITGVLDRDDPFNKRNIYDIYYTILIGDIVINKSLNLPNISNRFDRKLYVVEHVGNTLYEFLNKI